MNPEGGIRGTISRMGQFFGSMHRRELDVRINGSPEGNRTYYGGKIY